MILAVERIADSLERFTGVQSFSSDQNVTSVRPAATLRFDKKEDGKDWPEVATTPQSAGLPDDAVVGLQAELAEIKELLRKQQKPVPPTEKHAYTVKEAAELTGYKPWTIRQAANKGRIQSQKSPDGQWRIPHEEVTAIQNQGLPN